MQSEKHPKEMTEPEAGWRERGEGGGGGGVADEDDDDFNWIQTVVCLLVWLHYPCICFHLMKCFYRWTDWTGLLLLLLLFFKASTLCDRALGSKYCRSPQKLPLAYFITAQCIPQNTHSMASRTRAVYILLLKQEGERSTL